MIISFSHCHQMQINMRIMSADTKFNCLHNFPPVFCKCMRTILCFGVEFETGFVEFLQLMDWVSVGRVVQVVVGVVLRHASTASYSELFPKPVKIKILLKSYYIKLYICVNVCMCYCI